MEYACHAYHEDLPKGKASGQLVLGEMGFNILVNNQKLHVPFLGCQLELGGASDRILFIRHSRLKDWTFYSSDRGLLKDPLLKDKPELRDQIFKVRRKRFNAGAIVATVVFLIVAPPTLLIFNMDWVSAQIAKKIPAEWEQTLGESVIEQYADDGTLLEEDKALALLNPLVQPLLDQIADSRYQYNFYIALDETTNAFALPGGYVVIHTELISSADSAEELLGVLAHEIHHVENQHGVRNVIGTAGLYTLFAALFGDVNGVLSLVVGAAPYLLNQSYSRDFEREADLKGVELLQSANIDPRGLPLFFEKMMVEEDAMLEEIEDPRAQQAIDQAMGFLSTHPASEERVAYLSELTENADGEFRDLDEEFSALKNAVKQFVEENQ